MAKPGYEGEIGSHDWGGFVSAQSPPQASGLLSQEASIRAEADSSLSVRIDNISIGDVSGVALLADDNVFTNVNTIPGIRVGTVAVGSDYAVLPTDFEVLVDATGGAVTITLPTAMGSGQYYRIKKIDSTNNVVAVVAAGSDVIDDSGSVNLVDQWADCTVIDASFGQWDNASPNIGDVAFLDRANVFTNVNTIPGIRVGTLAIGSDYAVLPTDFEILVDASSGPITITLPVSAGNGQFLRIKKIDATANAVTVQTQGSDVIDDSGSVALTDQWSGVMLIDASFGLWDDVGTGGGGGGMTSVTSAQLASVEAHANVVSARAVSISAELASLLASASTALEAHINAVSLAGVTGGASVTSNEISVLVQTASAAATSADAHANTVSARLVSVSAELASLVQIASAVATSADSHANTVSARVASVSAELDSLLASVESRLSTRIDGVSTAGGSVTSTEIHTLIDTVSAAADNANTHANTVSARVVSVSSELASLVQIASAAATSANTHANTASAAATSADAHANTVSARVVSVSTELGSLVQIASAAATSADTHANTASAAATSADSHANTVSARAVSISAELGSLIQIASAAATSADAHANTVSARAVSISAELVSLIQIASAAATSADSHANTVSARAVSISAEVVSLFASASATLEAHINAVSATTGQSPIVASGGTNADTSINSTSYQTILSVSVPSITANSTVIVEIWGTIFNNSGSTRTYATQFNVGAATIYDAADPLTIAASSTGRSFRYERFVMSISATNLWRSQWTHHQLASSAADGQIGTSIYSDWDTGTDNLTGTQTITFKVKSNDATATQTFTLQSYRVERIAQI